MYGNSTRSWIIQIFYLPNDPMATEGLSYPGIRTLIKRGQIVLTPIPTEYRKMRRKLLLVTAVDMGGDAVR
jgi:DNA-binding transcriptional MocR family regulator